MMMRQMRLDRRNAGTKTSYKVTSAGSIRDMNSVYYDVQTGGDLGQEERHCAILGGWVARFKHKIYAELRQNQANCNIQAGRRLP
jgi:hypothetical protein